MWTRRELLTKLGLSSAVVAATTAAAAAVGAQPKRLDTSVGEVYVIDNDGRCFLASTTKEGEREALLCWRAWGEEANGQVHMLYAYASMSLTESAMQGVYAADLTLRLTTEAFRSLQSLLAQLASTGEFHYGRGVYRIVALYPPGDLQCAARWQAQQKRPLGKGV